MAFMSRQEDQSSHVLMRSLVIMALLIASFGFVIDLIHTFNSGGIDFRNRVVGARLLIAGLDPYYFRWTPDQPEEWLDPLDKPASPVSRTTVTPSTLLVLAPVASLHYKTIRFIWFLFQWGAFLFSMAILARISGSKEKAAFLWVIGLIFVAGSPLWRNHVEVGQIYILYVLLLVLAYWSMLSSRSHGALVSGFIIGLTVSFRPPIALILVPMVIYRQWKVVIGSAAGLAFAVLGSIAISGVGVWKSFFSAMRAHGGLQWSRLPSGSYPAQIEGMTNLTELLTGARDTSLYGLFNRSLGMNMSSVLPLALAVLVLVSGCILYWQRRKQPSASLIFQIGMVFVFVGEFFVPAPRYRYQDIIWLPLLALVIINADSVKSLLTSPLVLIALLGLCLIDWLIWIPAHQYPAEAAMVLYFTLTTVSYLRKCNEEVTAPHLSPTLAVGNTV